MSTSAHNIIAWVLQVLLGLAFIASGFKKFTSLPSTVRLSSSMGPPGALACVIAGAQLLGSTGLPGPRFVRLVTPGPITIMIGTLFMHATKIPGGLAKGVPALMLLVLRQPVPATV